MKFKSNEISLQFKVWCPIFNRVKHRLFLLGSLPELGAWNIYDALEAYPTPDNHTWQVDVIVPAGSSFEWVWLRTGLNRTGVEWERSIKRNRTVGYFSGVIHSIWANSEEVYLQSATFAEITTYTIVEDGYTLVLSGSTPTTGLWNLAKAVQATEFPKKSGYWKVHVSFDALTNLDFQWAIVKEKDFTSVGVMEKVKHSITGRRGWMRVVAPWMVPVAGVVDISIRNDTLDNAYGRTSILVKERQNRKEEITTWINSCNKKYTQAMKQRPPKQSVSEESKTTSDRTKVSDITIDPILTRQPAVRSNENLDELIQKTQERIFKETNTERFTKQLNQGYTDKCETLKGQRQIDVPLDPINSDDHNVGVRQKAQELKSAGCKQNKSRVSRFQDATDSDARSGDLKQVHFEPHDLSDIEWISSLEDVTSEATSSTVTQTAAEVRSDCLSEEDFCHMSASMAQFVASDTGFTELPTSWMSSMTNVPRLSTTLTGQLDVPLLSADFDEGFSEADITLVSTLVKQHPVDTWSPGPANQTIDTWPPAGPSKQAIDTLSPEPAKQALDTCLPGPEKPDAVEDCFPSFSMDDDEEFHQVTSTCDKDFTVSIEDRLHLDWLADKVKFEEDYCIGTLGIDNPPSNYIMNSAVFAPFSTITDASNVNQDETVTEQWTKSISDKAEELWTIPGSDGLSEETPNSSSYDGCFSQAQEKLCGPSCSLPDARAVARELEERWGAGLSVTDSKHYGVYEKFMFCRDIYAFYDAFEGVTDQLDIEDRRAIAREIERTWCQAAVV